MEKYASKDCPVKWFSEFDLIFRGYNWATKGILPYSGGWADQPAHLMELIDLVSGEVMEEKKNGDFKT